MADDVSGLLKSIKVADRACFFDKLAIRTDRALTAKQMALLRANADSVDIRHGRPIRGSKNALLLTIVNVNARGLRFIAEHPAYTINYAEVALDLILPDERSTQLLRDAFDASFVQSWHGRHRNVAYKDTTYSGQRRAGRSYAWSPTGNPNAQAIRTAFTSRHVTRASRPCVAWESMNRLI